MILIHHKRRTVRQKMLGNSLLCLIHRKTNRLPLCPETIVRWLTDGLAHLAFRSHAVLYDGGRSHPWKNGKRSSDRRPHPPKGPWRTLRRELRIDAPCLRSLSIQ